MTCGLPWKLDSSRPHALCYSSSLASKICCAPYAQNGYPTGERDSMERGHVGDASVGRTSHQELEVGPRGYSKDDLSRLVDFQFPTRTQTAIKSILVGQDKIPFSHRCLRRLPSLPFNNASRLFRLSRRSGSRRRYVVDDTAAIVSSVDLDTILTRETDGLMLAGIGPSRGIDSAVEVPLIPSVTSTWATESEMSRICSEAAACSVHAEISCWVRLLAAGRSSRTIGWIAMLRW